MNRVVITGGGGFIGAAIARELQARGDRVIVIGRSDYPKLAALGISCLRGDIGDRAFMEGALAKADLVFHVAAKAGIWGSRQDFFRSNVTGTVNVLRSCGLNKVPALVYTSTPSVVFNRRDLQGVDETVPYAEKTLCHYATSKIIAEKLVLGANCNQFRTTAIRPHLVWGPGDPHLLPRLIDRGRKKMLKIVGNGLNKVDIAFIDNVVHAHLLAADNLLTSGSAAGRPFFIGQEQPVVLWNWINDLFAELGIEPVRQKIPLPLAYGVGAVLETVYSGLKLKGEPKMTRFVALQLGRSHWFRHDSAERILGYQPVVTLREGVERFLRTIKS